MKQRRWTTSLLLTGTSALLAMGAFGTLGAARVGRQISAVPPGGDLASQPTFVHPPARSSDASAGKVTLPPVAKPGEHPRLLLTRAEADDLKRDLAQTERGRAARKALLDVADGALKGDLAFPDPSGPPAQMKDRGDAVARQHSALSQNAGTLGIAYALTSDVRYARRAAEILRGYAERYAAYSEHKGVNRSDTGKVMAQRLSEAMWLIPLIESYDYIHDSGALTAGDRTRIENDLIRPAIAFIRRKSPAAEAAERTRRNPNWRTAPPAKRGAANWLLFYNAATMMAGAVLEDANLKDLAAADLRFLIANGVGSDGMWTEGAIGYQFFALTALVQGMETAARQGIDLWSFDNRRVQALFDSPLRYAYPDGTAPGINDSGRARLGNWSTMVYDYAYLRYGDPRYGALVNASPRQLQMTEAVYFPTRVYRPLPETTAARQPSMVFESLGYAILRSPRAYALMDYGPHGGVHGHRDKLNLILFFAPDKVRVSANDAEKTGDEMGGEPVFHRYEDPLHDTWTTQTVAHNTLAVDETSQAPSEGTILAFEDGGDIAVMRAATDTSAPGALLDRTVVAVPGAVLDLYHGRSTASRTWDRTLRFAGALQGLPAVASNAAPLGTDNGYQHLHVAARQSGDSGWKGVWQTPKVGPMVALVAGAPGQQMLLLRGPDDDQIALARQQGTQADFAAAYGLESWPDAPQSLRMLPTDNPNVTAVTLNQPNKVVTLVFVARGRGSWRALGWRSDARVLCVRAAAGGARKLLLVGGTFAQSDTLSLRRTKPGNYAAETRASETTLRITSAWTPTETHDNGAKP